MLKFGFEVEEFVYVKDADGLRVIVPPAAVNPALPVDGFPGLLELRTTGGKPLEAAYAEIISQFISLDLKHGDVNFQQFAHTFTGDQYAWMRKNATFDKQPVDVRNLYGKKRRLLGNRTIAACQINISNQLQDAYSDKAVYYPAQYGLLDIPTIISAFDKEFEDEILQTKRQRGMYAIKDGYRLEYQSLPNCVFPFDPDEAKVFLSRIRKCVGM